MKIVSERGSADARAANQKSNQNRSSQVRAPQSNAEHIDIEHLLPPQEVVTQHTAQQRAILQSVDQRPFSSYTEQTFTPAQHAALQNVLKESSYQRAQSQQLPAIQPEAPAQQRPVAEPVQEPGQTRPTRPVAEQQRRPRPQQPGPQRTRPQQPPTPQRQPAPQRQRNSKAYARASVPRKKKSLAKKRFLTSLLVLTIICLGIGAWYYWWTEYATFDYQLQTVVILEGEPVQPEDFMFPSEDMQRVAAAYRGPGLRPAPGRQEVRLTLTRGWRTLDAVAILYVMTTVKEISHEYREEGPELNAIDFVANASIIGSIPIDVHFTETPKLLEAYEVGYHTLQLSLNDAPFEVLLTVTDTTAPTATAISKTIQIGEEVIPEDFIEDVFDHSQIESIEFVDAPDVLAHRDQIVQVEVTDIHGNSDIFSGGLTILLNTDAPEIHGTDAIVVMVEESILYRRDVTATDDFGRDITDRIDVDSSGVDQFTAGEYTVIYSVEDFTGLRTEAREKVYVVEIDIEYVHDRVDRVLSDVTNSGMSQLEKARAIHTWIRRNVRYSPVRHRPTTAYEGAYVALSRRSGNCFIFYSISEVMLSRAGIPNMRIDRIDSAPTRHRWNLINPDELGWHHFDANPTRLGVGVQMAFFTDTQARSYTRQLYAHNVPSYFTFNPELYPEIVQ